jgi:hypothetical protein
MAISLKEYKERIKENLIEIHWKQWSALGVSSHIPPEDYWIIDVEPLLSSTLAIGLYDKRLLNSCVEWWLKNGDWVNYARLKRVLKVFVSPSANLKEPILNPKVIEILSDTIKRLKPIAKKFTDFDVSEKIPQEYEKAFAAFRIRNIVKKIEITKPPSLLQLLLRGYFGIDAHVETFIYLLIHNTGNSNEIAKKIYHSQRNIYTILERWVKAGMLTKLDGVYSLNKKKDWFRILGLKKTIKYINWVRTFTFLDSFLKAISISKWAENEYSLSSKFREMYTDAAVIGNDLNMQIPEPATYKGAQYFEPFTTAVIEILHRFSGKPLKPK